MEDSGSSPSGVTGEPVDTSGLSFTATYDDGTTGSVIPSSYTPTSFGDTVGTQTVTFSFEGTDITVDVDYDVESRPSALTVTSISISGTPTNAQQLGQFVDYTGCTFTYGLSDGTTIVKQGNDGTMVEGVPLCITYGEGFNYEAPRPEWADTSETLVTVRVATENDESWWVDEGYEVPDPAPSTTFDFAVEEPVLDSLEITGSLTNTQYLTGSPDLTGLTIKAVYDNGDKVTLSLSDPNLDVSPATYTYTTGSLPTSTDLTISYTDGEVTATSGVQNVEVHGKTEYDLPIDEANVAYYDGFTVYNQDNCPGIGDLAGGAEVSIGDHVHLIFTEDAWDNGTTIGISDIMALVPSYGVDMSNFGAFGEGDGNNYKVDYYKMGLTGEGTAETGVSIVVALAPLTRVIDVQTGYSKADLDMTDSLARVYKLNVAVS